MSAKDRQKWDKKYKETPKLLQPREASKKVVKFSDRCEGKKALDVACGSGRNSLYLASIGFDVESVDISQVALDVLKEKNIENIHTKLLDLDDYAPAKESYDLIIKCNYLQRDMIKKLSFALKKGGVMIVETYMNHESNTKPNSNPDFLLQKDELKSFFDENFKILEYEEFDNEAYEIYRMKKQSIVVKKV